jgi:hypothetical protein
MRRSIRFLLIATTTVVVSACQQGDSGTTPMVSTSEHPPNAAPVIRNPSNADQPVSFSIGSNDFVAPTDVVGFQVAYQGQRVDFVTLRVSLKDIAGHSGSDATHRVDYVLISLQHRTELPIALPETLEEAEAEFDRRYPDRQFRTSVSEALGLLEIKYQDARDYVAYRRTDDYVRPNDGLIPTVYCLTPSSPTLCDGRGFIKPDIAVKYRFSPTRLPEWPTIDEEVFNYVEEIRQQKNVVEE